MNTTHYFPTYTRRKRNAHINILDFAPCSAVSLQCEKGTGLPQPSNKTFINPCRSKSRFHPPPPADTNKHSQGRGTDNIMAIPYSLVLRHNQPGEPEQGNKTFPMAQYAQLLDLAAMAEHMTSHGSKYDKGDIMAMATQMTSCIREQLLLGNKVALGDLGAFAVSLESKSAPNAESFHIGLIKKVKVKWEPSAKFTDLLNEAQFQYVGTRKSQNEARKAERELLNSMATIQPGQEPEDGGDDNTGGEDNGNLGE